MTLALWAQRLWVLGVAALTVAPLIRTGSYISRCCDFPRLQIAGFAAIGFVANWAVTYWTGWTTEAVFTAALGGAIVLWQVGHSLPYTPLWPVEVPDALGERRLSVMVSNLDFENEEKDAGLAVLREHDADLLLLVEIDEPWAQALAPLRERYPHRLETIRDQGLGIALWSKLPLSDTSIREIVTEDRASLHCHVQPEDMSGFRLVGVHPTPPGLEHRSEDSDGRYDSRLRDAELVVVAKEIRDAEADTGWLVTGDFNDVAWSRSTRLFQRLSGLKDPRVGRRLCNTYHAQYPFLRYPLDHVFVSQGFTLHDLCRVKIPGSDHFALRADLGVLAPRNGDHDADEDDEELADEMLEEGAKDAQEKPLEFGDQPSG